MPLQLTVRTPRGTAFSVTIDSDRVSVGRASTADVRVPFPTVSSRHLEIARQGADWAILDVGSTNGTVVDGAKLQPGVPVVVSDELVADIVDVRLEFRVRQEFMDGFTLAETGTMVRQMVGDALDQQQADDLAFFEIFSGKGAGNRVALPDDIDQGWVGSAKDALLQLEDPAVAAHVFRVLPDGDGFAIDVEDHARVQINGEAATGRCPLRSRDRIATGGTELIFFDPLEAYLDELDGVGIEEPSAATEPPPGDAAEEAAEGSPKVEVDEDVSAADGGDEGADDAPSQVAGEGVAAAKAEQSDPQQAAETADGDDSEPEPRKG